MPKSKYKGRGKVKRYRTIKLSKNKYLKCAVMSKKGKRKGRTVCTLQTRRKK